MQIQHLINGAAVPSRDYFETVNPATQEVLAAVARGGEREVAAAVAEGRGPPPVTEGLTGADRPRYLQILFQGVARVHENIAAYFNVVLQGDARARPQHGASARRRRVTRVINVRVGRFE